MYVPKKIIEILEFWSFERNSNFRNLSFGNGTVNKEWFHYHDQVDFHNIKQEVKRDYGSQAIGKFFGNIIIRGIPTFCTSMQNDMFQMIFVWELSG